MGHFQRIPYGNKHIARGIWLSWTGNCIVIRANLEISGASATREMANRIKQTIEGFWNASFDNGYSVSCRVDLLFRTLPHGDHRRNQIYVTLDRRNWRVTDVHWEDFYNSFMNYCINDETTIQFAPAHEFGHMLGLRDRYVEGQRIAGRRTSTVVAGWETNMMATQTGRLERRNLEELFHLHATEWVSSTLQENLQEGSQNFWRSLDRLANWPY